MPLVVHNTLTRRKELFTPRNDGRVKLFTCGPSVYRRQHLGNFRTFAFEDVLQKYLEYLGMQVDRVINFTDVEDKSIQEAQQKGTSVQQLVAPVIDRFEEDARRLGMTLPDEIPRASTSVDQAVELIRGLLDRNVAYWHDANVYFDPRKYPGFGEIYGLDMSRWPEKKVRFSRDTYEGNRWNLGDFILWHGEDHAGGLTFDSAIGRGRPAWNVQDAAMITKHLGYEIDIHTGGIDNLYRHHDYNRAIVEAASGTEFAHYWLHGEHLIVKGQKMSKSKGNTLYLDDLLERGFSAREVRFQLIYGHYRDKMDITDQVLEDSRGALRDLTGSLRRALAGARDRIGADGRATRLVEEIPVIFETQMGNDLDVRSAVDNLAAIASELAEIAGQGRLDRETAGRLRDRAGRIDSVLGVLEP